VAPGQDLVVGPVGPPGERPVAEAGADRIGLAGDLREVDSHSAYRGGATGRARSCPQPKLPLGLS
jgi:hypothetical protein